MCPVLLCVNLVSGPFVCTMLAVALEFYFQDSKKKIINYKILQNFKILKYNLIFFINSHSIKLTLWVLHGCHTNTLTDFSTKLDGKDNINY